ncbi:trans-sulfuration enzyme family protein [Vibrio viridaestus]|nr:aminotransferase class I/II-fold pyridoxal phosphate-dependent enzyme [Vibrio viridaestus]
MNDILLHPETKALGANFELTNGFGAIAPDISMSVNNIYDPDSGNFSAKGMTDLIESPYVYAGWSNPTVRQLEKRLSELEAIEETFVTASGMAAISGTLLSLLHCGDHLIVSDVCYAAVSEFIREILPRYGVEVSIVNLTDSQTLRDTIQSNTRLVYAETPCNPLLRLTDLKAIADICHEHDCLLCVDSTFATPVVTKPSIYGADLVIHSLTKFINGHGDVLGGSVSGSKYLVSKIRAHAGVYLGATMTAQSAWLIMRGIDTLFARMRWICESSLNIAQWLESHPNVIKVNYPGLESHPQNQLAQRQMNGFGGVISFQVTHPSRTLKRFMREAKLFLHAFSLGHQRSLVVYLNSEDLVKTSYDFSQQQKEEYLEFAGEGLFRLSIGLENSDDLINELQRVLA